MKIFVFALIMTFTFNVKAQVRTGGGPFDIPISSLVAEVIYAERLIGNMKEHFYKSRKRCGNPLDLKKNEDTTLLQFKLTMYHYDFRSDDYFNCLNTQKCQRNVLAVSDNQLATVLTVGARGLMEESIFYQICKPY